VTICAPHHFSLSKTMKLMEVQKLTYSTTTPKLCCPLKSIVNELTSDVALVKKLVNKFIEANNAK
jgi:hypothetical protein